MVWGGISWRELTLVKWALDSSWCRTMPRPHVTRVCRHFLDDVGIDAVDWPLCSPDLSPIENQLTKLPSSTKDCPGAHGCPDPGLAGDPPGHHPSSHQEHA